MTGGCPCAGCYEELLLSVGFGTAVFYLVMIYTYEKAKCITCDSRSCPRLLDHTLECDGVYSSS